MRQINGEFKCFGTLVQLKNKYGRGIRITLKACPDFTIDSIALKFSQEYPNAKRFGQPQQLDYQLPLENFSFYKMFRFLQDSLKTQLKMIDDFSISHSSLEQIFLDFSQYQQQVLVNQ